MKIPQILCVFFFSFFIKYASCSSNFTVTCDLTEQHTCDMIAKAGQTVELFCPIDGDLSNGTSDISDLCFKNAVDSDNDKKNKPLEEIARGSTGLIFEYDMQTHTSVSRITIAPIVVEDIHITCYCNSASHSRNNKKLELKILKSTAVDSVNKVLGCNYLTSAEPVNEDIFTSLKRPLEVNSENCEVKNISENDMLVLMCPEGSSIYPPNCLKENAYKTNGENKLEIIKVVTNISSNLQLIQSDSRHIFYKVGKIPMYVVETYSCMCKNDLNANQNMHMTVYFRPFATKFTNGMFSLRKKMKQYGFIEPNRYENTHANSLIQNRVIETPIEATNMQPIGANTLPDTYTANGSTTGTDNTSTGSTTATATSDGNNPSGTTDASGNSPSAPAQPPKQSQKDKIAAGVAAGATNWLVKGLGSILGHIAGAPQTPEPEPATPRKPLKKRKVVKKKPGDKATDTNGTNTTTTDNTETTTPTEPETPVAETNIEPVPISPTESSSTNTTSPTTVIDESPKTEEVVVTEAPKEEAALKLSSAYSNMYISIIFIILSIIHI